MTSRSRWVVLLARFVGQLLAVSAVAGGCTGGCLFSCGPIGPICEPLPALDAGDVGPPDARPLF